MDLLKFSSLIDLIKTQGSVLDVDLWMELTDVVFLGPHVRTIDYTYTDYHNGGCLGETFSSLPILQGNG